MTNLGYRQPGVPLPTAVVAEMATHRRVGGLAPRVKLLDESALIAVRDEARSA